MINTVAAEDEPEAVLKVTRTKHMSLEERWSRTSALWPYILPLLLVYFAEYSMQVIFELQSHQVYLLVELPHL